MEEQTTPPPPPPETQRTPEQADIAENKDLAALSYVWILAIVVYFSNHNSTFVKFHCRQGLVLFVLSLVGAILPAFIGTLLLLFVLGLCVIGFLNAAQGLKKELPVIGRVSRGDINGLQHALRDILEKIRGFMKQSKKTPPAEQKPATPPSAPALSHPVTPPTHTEQTPTPPDSPFPPIS